MHRLIDEFGAEWRRDRDYFWVDDSRHKPEMQSSMVRGGPAVLLAVKRTAAASSPRPSAVPVPVGGRGSRGQEATWRGDQERGGRGGG